MTEIKSVTPNQMNSKDSRNYLNMTPYTNKEESVKRKK